MYQEIFDFSGRPFTMAPFVKHFFHDGPVKQALDQINESISRDAGPAIVIGQHGTGKSLLLTLLSEQHQQTFKVISLSCAPMTERRDLLQAILFELKQPYHNLSEGELRLSLIDFVKPVENCPNGVLLLVDDAQSLCSDLVDELRLITNFVRDGVPRVRLVICGTGRLEEVLTEPKLEPFNQRISSRCFLGNLTREQTQAYIHEHVARVGGDAATMFDQATTDAIHEATSGCPRFINQLAEQCMSYAAIHGSMVVEANMVEPAWAQVQGLPTASSNSSAPVQSEDENWTVIEFGTLDDEPETPADEDQMSARSSAPTEEFLGTQDTNESSDESTNAEYANTESAHAELTNAELTDDSLDSPATDAASNENEASWDDVGTTDPFVAPEQAEEDAAGEAPYVQVDDASDSTNTDSSGYQPQSNDQPLNAVLVEEDDQETTTEASSIPTEFLALAQDQEETWAAAGVANDTPLNEQTDEESGDSSDAPSVVDAVLPAVPVIAAAAAAASIANPFAEAFESEEPVSNEFTDQLAEQNVSSMTVTGEQLDQLSPPNDDPESNDAFPVVSLVDEVPAAPDPMEDQTAEIDDHAQTILEAERVLDTAEQEPEAEAPAPAEYSANELASVFGSLPTDDTATAEPEEPVADFYPAATSWESDPDSGPVTEVTSFVDDMTDSTTVSSASTQPEQQSSTDSETDSDADKFHQHNTPPPTADIQEQANEILSSIRTPETEPIESSPEADTPLTYEPRAPETHAAQENNEVSDAQRILSEILEHKKLLSEQIESPAITENEAPDLTDYPQSLSIRTAHSIDQSTGDSFENEPDQTTQPSGHTDTSSSNDAFNADGNATSTGRATRMNYEKLFEQLRDNGDQS